MRALCMVRNKLSLGAGRRLANWTYAPFKSLNKERLEVGQERDAGVNVQLCEEEGNWAQ